MTIVHATDPIGFGSTALDDDMFAVHTDGFAALGVSELVVTGHRNEIPAMAQAFAMMVERMFVDGTGSVPTPDTFASFGHIPVYFGDATAHADKVVPGLVAKAKQLGHSLAVTQMVVSGEDGRLPWESDLENSGQALFCKAPTAATTLSRH